MLAGGVTGYHLDGPSGLTDETKRDQLPSGQPWQPILFVL